MVVVVVGPVMVIVSPSRLTLVLCALAAVAASKNPKQTRILMVMPCYRYPSGGLHSGGILRNGCGIDSNLTRMGLRHDLEKARARTADPTPAKHRSREWFLY